MFVVKLSIIWLAIDTITLATVWYLLAVVRPHWPAWWRRTVADDAPQNETL
jgi:hypothetical protein